MKPPSHWKSRSAGILLLVTTAWYLIWVFGNLNREDLWLSVPFGIASGLMATLAFVTVLDHWHYDVPEPRHVAEGDEPAVAVIIPTLGEPEVFVEATAISVLEQDYPHHAIRLIISDDGHRPAVQRLTEHLAERFPKATIAYHEPPLRGDPARHGEAKAGNLNSAMLLVRAMTPHVAFVETRDADDLVGDPSFLRQAVGQLQYAPRLAYVQTIKEAMVSPGDPFGNQEPLFYRNAMIARNAGNSVFPCGSGLVWRREALEDIEGFPVWNLVEDLQSGVEALRRGWSGLYLPIVGAIGQTAPEDLPNAIKQRGTWALDTMRMSIWGQRKGLSLRQHVQFAELGMFYLSSFGVLGYVIAPIISLVSGQYPVRASALDYVLHAGVYAASIELMLMALTDGLPYRALWRARQIWLGMAPVYARASLVAFFFGPKHKPAYRVTRKHHRYGFYLADVWLQATLFFGLLLASLYHIIFYGWSVSADYGMLLWALFFAVILSQTMANTVHGLNLRARAARAIRPGQAAQRSE